MMPRLILLAAVSLTAAALTGCAPAADLRVPAYQGAPVAGRLLVVHAGPVVATPAALDESGADDAAAFEAATWEALHGALSTAYRFTSVEGAPLPDSMALQPVFTSRQVVTEGRAGDRWVRKTLYLPSAPFRDVAAEYVLVVDTVYADWRLGSVPLRPTAGEVAATVAANVVLGAVLGVGVVPTSRLVRGSWVRARFSLYRPGSSVPLMVGEMEGFGAGPGGTEPESALAQSVRSVAESLGRSGRFEER